MAEDVIAGISYNSDCMGLRSGAAAPLVNVFPPSFSWAIYELPFGALVWWYLKWLLSPGYCKQNFYDRVALIFHQFLVSVLAGWDTQNVKN